MVVKLKIEKGWLTFEEVHAPTDDSRSKVKDHFYTDLQRSIDKVERR